MEKLFSGLLIAILLFSGCGGKEQKQEATITPSIDQEVVRIKEDSLAETLIHDEELLNQEDSLPIPPPPIFIPEVLYERSPYRRSLIRRTYIEFPEFPENEVYVFYYVPEMFDKEYPFLQKLGNDHNTLDYSSAAKGIWLCVPDTIDAGAKLMFRALGYEPYDLPVDNSLSRTEYVPVIFQPKTYTTTVILHKINDEVRVKSLANEKPSYIGFLGDCLPIYDSDGIGHGDPECAFSCMGMCFPQFYLSDVREVFMQNGEDLNTLYKTLENGEKCSFLFSSGLNGITVVAEQLPANLDTLEKTMQEMNWKIPSSDGRIFKIRMNVVIDEK